MNSFRDWYDEVGESFDFLCLQEVGQLGSLQVVKEYDGDVFQYFLKDVNELQNYMVLGSTQTSSHLGQVILLRSDCVDSVLSCWRGDRFVATKLVLKGSKHHVVIASCHMPHSDQSDDVYQDALRDIIQLFIDHKHLPIILLGDFNCEHGTERGIALESAFTTRRGKVFSSNSPTRFGKHSAKELDFLCCNSAFHAMLLPEDNPKVIAHPNTRHELGSDHCYISFMVAVKTSQQQASYRGSRRKRRHKPNRCRRWSCDKTMLSSCLPALSEAFRHDNVQVQWEQLVTVSKYVSMPKTSVKYQDSNTFKGLCQQRRLLTDDNERAALTRKILALRRVERTVWLHELHERSRRGDTTAIRYIKQRYKPNMGEAHDFVRSSGDIHAATTAMREHYQQLFGPDLPECQRRRVELVEHEFSSRAAQTPSPDFTEEEIQMAVDRLKHDKTTGLSGVSNEMLIQLWDLPEGAPLLHHHLNCLLRTNELPKGFCDAQVALIPKLESILKPGDYRPINLLESIHKLFAWLLITRLTPHWQLPTVQLGAIKGTQICDALLAAQARVTRDSKMQQYCIYLSCDVRAAFDSLSPGAVAAFLLEESDADRGHECLQMLRLLTRARLHFNWKGESWTTDQTSGVQQGGSHSAILFAYILGLAVQRLENRWRAQGHEPRHSSFSLLFVDDILLSFATWQEAIELTLQLQELLATMGLVLNEDKTKLMSHASVLEAGRRLQLPESSLLNRIDWGTTCMYLRKTLTHFEVGAQTSGVGFADTSMVLLEAAGKATHGAYESLHRCLQRGSWYCIDDTIKLCNRYVGGTWFWYSPLIEPLAACQVY